MVSFDVQLENTGFHAMFVFVLIYGAENKIITKLPFPVKKIDMFTSNLIYLKLENNEKFYYRFEAIWGF